MDIHTPAGLTVLHTSDWHLGHTLVGRKRHHEAAAFLDWLANTLEHENVDVLLVAGDVFDTAMPDTTAQRLYYDFLCRAFADPRRQVVVTAGNHDSPPFLSAPRDVLARLGVHVLASGDTPQRQVLTLRRPDGSPLCVVCAVPYLRDRDLRPAEAGENLQDRDRKLVESLHHHYAVVSDLARREQQALELSVPVLVMGHLFAAGGQAETGEGVRELYVGSLARAGSDLFPKEADYVALGHLHTPQVVNRCEHIRYSGAPLPMSPGETTPKSVCLVRFAPNAPHTPHITLLPTPRPQRMERVSGDWPAIAARVETLIADNTPMWLDVDYTGTDLPGALNTQLDALLREKGSTGVDILRVRDSRPQGCGSMERTTPTEHLEDMRPEDVFERRLDASSVPETQRDELRSLHREILLDALSGTEASSCV